MGKFGMAICPKCGHEYDVTVPSRMKLRDRLLTEAAQRLHRAKRIYAEGGDPLKAVAEKLRMPVEVLFEDNSR